MVIEDLHNRVLEYLKNQGPTNTFRLSTELGIDRYKILNIIKELKEKNAVGLEHGLVKFLRPPEEKKPIEIKKESPSKSKKKVKAKKRTQRKTKSPERLENFQEENKRLEEKLSKLKIIIRKQSSIENSLKEQAGYIEKLEKTIKELKQKVSIPPKIITKTIIKKVPIKRKKPKKKKIKSKKFKLLKINFSKLKNIQQLHIPKILRKFKG